MRKKPRRQRKQPIATLGLSTRLSSWKRRGAPHFAWLAVCGYVGGFAFEPTQHFALIWLGIVGLLAVLFGQSKSEARPWPPLMVPVSVLLATSLVSVVLSRQPTKSTWLNVFFIPGVLLFFLVAQHFLRLAEIRRLYLTFAAVAIGLATLVLMNTEWVDDRGTRAIIHAADSPALLVPNDVCFLALIAPFSIALVLLRPRSLQTLVVIPSLILTVIAIVALESRTGLVTLIVSLTAFAVLSQPRQRLKPILVYGFSVLGAVLVVDALLGASLAAKFLNNAGTRVGPVAKKCQLRDTGEAHPRKPAPRSKPK